MRRAWAFFAACCWMSAALAQSDVLIDIDRGRTEGVFTKSPVFQRAILAMPSKPTDTAVLFFRGYPGIARIESAADKERNLLPFMKLNQHVFAEAGLALVVMDCPTDQWNHCNDDYRSSQQHADDVRSVMAKLRQDYGLTRFYVFGHSMGSVSSRWLAKNLGNEIAGSIHSASMNMPNRDGYASSMHNFPYGDIAAPVLHVHHQNDACRSTQYSAVKAYAGDRLATVRGGVGTGDPCGGRHLHSYQGREEPVVRAIVAWIKTGKIEPYVGE
ncbi:MAG TPA: alpha/beta fold hydrolase [Burkholderiales bacterium]|nr:alpha/beta fold hydrolase [Burkholderiales bacterium]